MRTTCLIDLRCLQDPPYRERGIGRHARTLLAQARANLPAMTLIGITDAEMPALPEAERAKVDGIRTTSYTGALTTPCCFVQLSPMTHDPLFVARLLHHPAIPAATVVYDFIPYDDPQHYLAAPTARLDYHVALRWLARYQMFLPISADSSDALNRIFGTPRGRVIVTGAILAPAFESLAAGRPRHILVVGGDDPRKNPECAIRAHAIHRLSQEAQLPLVVTGDYDPPWIAARRTEVAALGGNPQLLRTPGHVDEATLLGLYADAFCVITPSLAEGFSLPVIEAMAASVPALASDIPAHRELLAEGLFAPCDHHALAGLLDRAFQPAWRDACLERQAKVWVRFTADAVGRRFWSPVSGLAPTAAPSAPARRPVIAVITPVPPNPSAIARYSAATCAELGKRAELHVFTATTDASCPAGAASVSPLSAYPHLASGFDRTVSILGNDPAYRETLRLLVRHGGAAILHDSHMPVLHARHWGTPGTVRAAGAELGRSLHDGELASWLSGDMPAAAMMLREITAAAEPVVMHSAAAAEAQRRFGRDVTHIPLSLTELGRAADATGQNRASIRRKLGIPDGAVLMISVGSVDGSKAPLDCLWALILLRSWGIDAQLHFVGQAAMSLGPLHALLAEHEIRSVVSLPGDRRPGLTARDYLMAGDVGIQIESTGLGSGLGGLADCVVAALPCVASASLARSVGAPAFVEPIPDLPSPLLIAEAVLRLLDRPPAMDALLDHASSRGFDRYAERLCQSLNLV